MEASYNPGKTQNEDEDVYLLRDDGVEFVQRPFILKCGPIKYRNPREFSKWEWLFLVVSSVSILAAILIAALSVVGSAQFGAQYVNMTDGLHSNFCRTQHQATVVFACQTDLILSLIVIVNTGFVLYFMIDGLFREDKFEICAFVSAFAFMCIYVLLDFVYETVVTQSYDLGEEWTLARLIVTVLVVPLDIVLALVVSWRMKYFIFNAIGNYPHLQKMYKWTRFLSALVKLNVAVFLSLFLLVVTRVPILGVPLLSSSPAPLAPHIAEVVLVCLLLVASVVGLVLAIFGMYMESRPLSILYLGSQGSVFVYYVFRIIWTSFSWSFHVNTVDPVQVFDATAVIAICIILLCVAGIGLTLTAFLVQLKVITNYGRGLQDKFFN